MPLNRYGLMALEFCRKHRPIAWAQTVNPESTFEDVGAQIQAEVTRVRDELMGPPRPNEHATDLQRRGAQSLRTAEELVLENHPAFRPETTPDDETTEDDPELSDYWRALATVNQAIHDQTA
jgi:hypothetical protein